MVRLKHLFVQTSLIDVTEVQKDGLKLESGMKSQVSAPKAALDVIKIVKVLCVSNHQLVLYFHGRQQCVYAQYLALFFYDIVHSVPEQIGGTTYGFFVMLYMKEIVEDRHQDWIYKVTISLIHASK